MHLVLHIFIFTICENHLQPTLLRLNFQSMLMQAESRLLTLRITCLDRSRWRYRGTVVGITRVCFLLRDGKVRMISDRFVVVRIRIHQLSIFSNTSHPMLEIRSKLLHNSTPSLNSSYVADSHPHSLWIALSNWAVQQAFEQGFKLRFWLVNPPQSDSIGIKRTIDFGSTTADWNQ